MTPVITHPERNGLLRQRVDQIAAWVAEGACVQVTAQSVLGEFGRRAAEFAQTLLDRRLVHFLASDAHDCEHRAPRLDLAHAWLKEQYGEERADALCVTNPKATLTGESLEPVEAAASSERRKWYRIWR
jgi:protein-tyrosine phosphatase